EQDRCLCEIERHQTADQSYLEEGVRILELARNAQRLFQKQEPREKRRLLNFLVSNCSWKGGELTAALRQPFDLLSETTAIAAQAALDGRRDSNSEMSWQNIPLKGSHRFPGIQPNSGLGDYSRLSCGLGRDACAGVGHSLR